MNRARGAAASSPRRERSSVAGTGELAGRRIARHVLAARAQDPDGQRDNVPPATPISHLHPIWRCAMTIAGISGVSAGRAGLNIMSVLGPRSPSATARISRHGILTRLGSRSQ